MVEAVFVVPMFVFLFIGTLDIGFYSYALISVQSAARVAALATAASAGTAGSSAIACGAVLKELATVPNAGSFGTACTSLPLIVSATACTNYTVACSQVSVTYQTLVMIPIPGILERQLTVTRIVQMPVYAISS